MAESFGARCSKYILFLFNFIFWLTGVALLGLGIWLVVDKNVVSYIEVITWDSEDPYLDVAAWVLIGTGTFIFLVGFCGCFGALRESRALIVLYVFFVLLVIIMELAAGIITVVFRGKIDDLLQDSLEEQVKEKYTFSNQSRTINLAWDRLQHELECCGVQGASDWVSSEWDKSQSMVRTTTYEIVVPWTCCVLTNNDPEKPEPVNRMLCQQEAAFNDPQNGTNYHPQGCYEKIKDWVVDNAVLLIAVGVAIAVIQLFGLIFACYLGFKIKQERSVGTYA